MPPESGFTAFGASHWAVLFLTFSLPLALAALHHRSPERRKRNVGLALAFVLVANKIALLAYSLWRGELPWQELLPMHLCDWTTFVVAIALLNLRQDWFDLAYFWGLAGTLQAVLTPDLAYDFPHFYFISFNISHSGIIAGVLYLCLGPGLRPWPSSLWKAFAWLQFYLVCAALVNLLLETNYGYLCHKPSRPSLLDYFGTWPWYLLTLEAAALASFVIYYSPYALKDALKGRSRTTWTGE